MKHFGLDDDLYSHLDKFNRNIPFWQANYHDHSIRDPQSFERFQNILPIILQNGTMVNSEKMHRYARTSIRF